MEAFVFQQAITLASLAAVCLVTSEVLANRTHAYRIHAKMALIVHLCPAAPTHVHVRVHIRETLVHALLVIMESLASQIHVC